MNTKSYPRIIGRITLAISLFFCIQSGTAQDRVLFKETFPNAFNTSFQRPINSSFLGSLGQWQAFSDNSYATLLVNNARPRTGAYAMKVYNDGGSNKATANRATSPKLDLSDASADASVQISFWLWCFQLHNNSNNFRLRVEVSGNDGATWTEIYSKTGNELYDTYGEGSWKNITISIAKSFRTAGFRFRISGSNAANTPGNQNTYLYIDDIEIIANLCGVTLEQIPNFSGAPDEYTDANRNGRVDKGDEFVYRGVITRPERIDAYIKIEDILNSDVEGIDNQNDGEDRRLQPIVRTGALTKDEEGWVQIAISFKRAIDGSRANIANLQFRHYDLDGIDFSGTGFLQETVWLTGTSAVLRSANTNLEDGGVVEDSGYRWRKVLGRKQNYQGIQDNQEISFTTTFNSASVVRYRLGFIFQKGNSGNQVSYDRLFSSLFGCFDLSTDIPLPVRLVSFDGSLQQNTAQLRWETAMESNINRYEVQRMVNGNFQTVGTVTARNAAGAGSYQYTDNVATVAGTLFTYRLFIVENDGKTTYSRSLSLAKGQEATTGLKVVPNPARNGQSTVVQLSSDAAVQAQVTVVNSQGAVVSTQKTLLQRGSNAITLSFPESVPSGTYLVRVQAGNKIANTTFIIQ